jgi:AmiR/NasT family two-component response regulator
MDKYQIKDNPAQARDRYKIVSPNLKIKDVTGEDMTWVESMCKSVNPDVVVIDMGDKFARTAGYARPDEALKTDCKTI